MKPGLATCPGVATCVLGAVLLLACGEGDVTSDDAFYSEAGRYEIFVNRITRPNGFGGSPWALLLDTYTGRVWCYYAFRQSEPLWQQVHLEPPLPDSFPVPGRFLLDASWNYDEQTFLVDTEFGVVYGMVWPSADGFYADASQNPVFHRMSAQGLPQGESPYSPGTGDPEE